MILPPHHHPALGFPAISLESPVFRETARAIHLPLLFVKGVILPFLSFRFHQSPRLGIIRHRRRLGGQTEAATPHTYGRGSAPHRPTPRVAVLAEILGGDMWGHWPGVMEVEITQLLQFDLSIRPRPPSFTRPADGHHLLLSGQFKTVQTRFSFWTISL